MSSVSIQRYPGHFPISDILGVSAVTIHLCSDWFSTLQLIFIIAQSLLLYVRMVGLRENHIRHFCILTLSGLAVLGLYNVLFAAYYQKHINGVFSQT